MISFILEPANLPFAIAAGLLIAIALIEGIGMIVGMALSELVDGMFPDLDLDLDADIGDHGAFGEFLTWIRVREVPVLFIFLAFLTSFSITGFIIQNVAYGVMGTMMPSLLAAAIAFVVSLPGVRLFGGVMARIMPKDETESVSRDSFVGRPAVITLGVASVGNPAQARLKDKHGQSHYVMVAPDNDGESFDQGSSVLLVRRDGATFYAIQDTRTDILDA